MQQEFTVTTEEGATITVMVVDGVLNIFSMTHDLDAERDASNSFNINVGKAHQRVE